MFLKSWPCCQRKEEGDIVQECTEPCTMEIAAALMTRAVMMLLLQCHYLSAALMTRAVMMLLLQCHYLSAADM